MDAAQRQFLQLKSELERQKNELQKSLEEVKKNTCEAQQDIEWLQAHRQECDTTLPPQPSTAPSGESNTTPNTNNFYQGRVPSQEDLYKIAENPEKFGNFFTELDDWYKRDRADQEAAQPTTEGKWFGSDRPLPSIEEMMNQRNFEQMLSELEELR